MQAPCTMPVRSNLQLLVARVNVERAQRGETPLSLRQLALESGVAHSVVTNLAANRNERIDYATIDKLLTFINKYVPANTGELITWTPVEEERTQK